MFLAIYFIDDIHTYGWPYPFFECSISYYFFKYFLGRIAFIFLLVSMAMLASTLLFRCSLKSKKKKYIFLGIFLLFFCFFKCDFNHEDCGRWLFKAILGQNEGTWSFLANEEEGTTKVPSKRYLIPR
jgi:hypothetical protein